MKSNYKKLKRTILIRTGLVALLALVIGEGIVHFFIDGIFQGLFTRAMMAIFTGMHMDSEMANEWYGRIFMDHKTVFLVIGFIILFLIFYNLLVKRMLHYLSSVEAAIDAIQREDDEQIVLEKEQLNLSFLLEQLADESYGVLKDKYLTCSVKTDDDLMVMGDPDKLARVFDNLLRNAIAYSYTDTEIEIEARAKGTDIVITFENQGHEIPEQNLKLIFEKFYRVDNARSSQTGGSGLGLSIAKRIVELHGGIIEATSDWERTTFTVVLPGIHNPTQKVEIQEKEEEDPLSRHQKLGTNKKSEIGKKNRRRV